MQLNIIYNETFVLNNIADDDKILKIKELIYKKTNIPIKEQSLQWCGKLLNDKKTINDYKIKNNDLLFLSSELKGGNVPGFPDVGHLVLLLGFSTIFLILLYVFFNSIMNNLTFHAENTCGTLQNIEAQLNNNTMSTNTTGFTNFFQQKMSKSKNSAKNLTKTSRNIQIKKGQKGGDNQNNLYQNIYNISSMFYSALVIVIMTIYYYTMFCHDGLSNWIIIGTLSSLLLFLGGSVALYHLKNGGIKFVGGNIIEYINNNVVKLLAIGSTIISLGLFLLTLLVPFIKKTKYLHWSTYIYPIGVAAFFYLITYIGKIKGGFLKILSGLIAIIVLIFVPYILAYINNVYKMCS